MKTECRMQNAECGMLKAATRSTRHAPRTTQQSGVALVITLILLSVITFMAVTFLVLSYGERGSVATQTDLTVARLAADTALQRAQADLMGPILTSGNEFTNSL